VTASLLATAIGLGLVTLAEAAGPIRTAETRTPAVSIPDGFDWPADEEHLYRISGGLRSPGRTIPDEFSVPQQRTHGWHLFSGVTQPSQEGNPHSLPIFLTWYTADETFDQSEDRRLRRIHLSLEPSSQFLAAARRPLAGALEATGLSESARFDPDQFFEVHPGEAVFSHVAFNQDLHEFIRENGYYKRDVLNQLSDRNQVRIPLSPVPRHAVSLKFAWWPIARSKVTPLPDWDFDRRNPGDGRIPPSRWKRVVAVDPTGRVNTVRSLALGGTVHLNPKVVGLDRFFAVELSPAEADSANSDLRIRMSALEILGRNLQAGDYVVLTALHIATNEFDPWVFTTFWWHDDPNLRPYADQRTPDVQGVWRNYLMDCSYNINRPREPNGDINAAYNPWLELFDRGGLRSSCMSCHARSVYAPRTSPTRLTRTNPDRLESDDVNGFIASPDGPLDPAFARGTIDLHRIWTILTRSR
jgi:hypothetical protein